MTQLLLLGRSPGDEVALPLSLCRACGQLFVQLHPATAEAVDDGEKVGFQRLAGLEPLPPEGADEDERGILLKDRLITGDDEAGRPGTCTISAVTAY